MKALLIFSLLLAWEMCSIMSSSQCPLADTSMSNFNFFPLLHFIFLLFFWVNNLLRNKEHFGSLVMETQGKAQLLAR